MRLRPLLRQQLSQILDAFELLGRDVLSGEVGDLVVDQVVRQRVAVLGQEAPGIAGIGRLIDLEAVVSDDPDDVVPKPVG